MQTLYAYAYIVLLQRKQRIFFCLLGSRCGSMHWRSQSSEMGGNVHLRNVVKEFLLTTSRSRSNNSKLTYMSQPLTEKILSADPTTYLIRKTGTQPPCPPHLRCYAHGPLGYASYLQIGSRPRCGGKKYVHRLF